MFLEKCLFSCTTAGFPQKMTPQKTKNVIFEVFLGGKTLKKIKSFVNSAIFYLTNERMLCIIIHNKNFRAKREMPRGAFWCNGRCTKMRDLQYSRYTGYYLFVKLFKRNNERRKAKWKKRARLSQ